MRRKRIICYIVVVTIRTSLAIGKETVNSIIIGWLAFENLEGTVECQGKKNLEGVGLYH